MMAHIPRSDTDYRVAIEQIGRLERALLSVRESPVGSPLAVDAIALIQYQEITRLRAELDAALGFDGKETHALNGASPPDAALAHCDLARIRIPKTEGGGSLPISEGARIIRESRNMLRAAACSASRAQPAFGAQDCKRAIRYVEDARLTQTERGGIVISLPSAVRQPTDGGADGEPFARRAARKLASGLKAMREAADFAHRESDFAAFEKSVSDGVSANLCDAVGKMVGKRNPIEVEISVIWALAPPPPEESGAPIQFGGDDARILSEASRILKKLHESRTGWKTG